MAGEGLLVSPSVAEKLIISCEAERGLKELSLDSLVSALDLLEEVVDARSTALYPTFSTAKMGPLRLHTKIWHCLGLLALVFGRMGTFKNLPLSSRLRARAAL